MNAAWTHLDTCWVEGRAEGPPCLVLSVCQNQEAVLNRRCVYSVYANLGPLLMYVCVYIFQSLQQYGMTPLMHAAYKGKTDMCKLLLQHGADVNCNEHEHGYTALMFAGLSGMLTGQPPKDISLMKTQLLFDKASPCVVCDCPSVCRED